LPVVPVVGGSDPNQFRGPPGPQVSVVHLEGFAESIPCGIHGGIKQFYKDKYGREITGPEYPATLDFIIASVAG
jgi:hypothetical protein